MIEEPTTGDMVADPHEAQGDKDLRALPPDDARTDDDGWNDESDAPLRPLPTLGAVRIAQIAVAILALIVIGVLISNRGDDGPSGQSANTTPSDASDTTRQASANWSNDLFGRPPSLGARGDAASKVPPGARPGLYLWNDFDGWHLWLVNGDGIPPMTGSITSDDAIAKAELAVSGAGSAEASGNSASFALPTSPGLTGVDFNPGFYAKQIVISIDGPDGPIDAKLVKTGNRGNPAPFPLVFTKTASG